jgi:hypothetical protein
MQTKAKPFGPTCHNGTGTCWAEENVVWFLSQLETTITDRKTIYQTRVLHRYLKKVSIK